MTTMVLFALCDVQIHIDLDILFFSHLSFQNSLKNFFQTQVHPRFVTHAIRWHHQPRIPNWNLNSMKFWNIITSYMVFVSYHFIYSIIRLEFIVRKLSFNCWCLSIYKQLCFIFFSCNNWNLIMRNIFKKLINLQDSKTFYQFDKSTFTVSFKVFSSPRGDIHSKKIIEYIISFGIWIGQILADIATWTQAMIGYNIAKVICCGGMFWWKIRCERITLRGYHNCGT